MITFLCIPPGDNWIWYSIIWFRSGQVAGDRVGIVVIAIGIWLWKRQSRKRE